MSVSKSILAGGLSVIASIVFGGQAAEAKVKLPYWRFNKVCTYEVAGTCYVWTDKAYIETVEVGPSFAKSARSGAGTDAGNPSEKHKMKH